MTVEMGAFGADVRSPFVPVGVTPRYPPPRAHIPSEWRRSGERWRRALVAAPHAAGGARAQVDVRLLARRVVPRPRGAGADPQRGGSGDRLADDDRRPDRSSTSSAIIVALAVVRFVLTYVSRNYLLKTAYRIEYDLRNIMYEHLSRMSFSFYDRVQSGQLISRANSDIRSVQMYLTFAPLDPRAVQRRDPRVRGDAHDQRAAHARRDVDDAVRLHRRRPHAEADVPGVVAHPGPHWPTSPRSSTRTSTACASSSRSRPRSSSSAR